MLTVLPRAVFTTLEGKKSGHRETNVIQGFHCTLHPRGVILYMWWPKHFLLSLPQSQLRKGQRWNVGVV